MVVLNMCNMAHLMTDRTANKKVLVVWEYWTYLWHDLFSLNQHQFMEYNQGTLNPKPNSNFKRFIYPRYLLKWGIIWVWWMIVISDARGRYKLYLMKCYLYSDIWRGWRLRQRPLYITSSYWKIPWTFWGNYFLLLYHDCYYFIFSPSPCKRYILFFVFEWKCSIWCKQQ